MAEVLVFVDHVDGAVRKPTLELLTLARRFGEPVAVALGAGAGGDRRGVLAESRRGPGADQSRRRSSPTTWSCRRWTRSRRPREAVSPAAVLVPSSAEGKEIAARLAVRMGSGIITDAVDLEAGEEGPVATQSVFAASFTTKSRVTTGHAGHHGQAELGAGGGRSRRRARSRPSVWSLGALAAGTKVVARDAA